MNTQTHSMSSVLLIDAMNKLTEWVNRHQVATFFFITFAITWPILILVFFVFPGNQLVQILCGGPFAVFSPALAAMWISALSEPHPKQPSSKPRWIAFGVSWLISWLLLTLSYWYVEKMELVVAIIAWGVFALLPAWVLSSAYARTPGIRKQFTTILKPRGNLLMYLIAIFAIPMTQFLGVEITRLFGGHVQFAVEGKGFGEAVIFISLIFLRVFLTSGGVNEESGWRGFALPQLQRRYPVILAIGIVYFYWALWHLPYDIGLGTPVNWIILNRTFYAFLFSVLFSWVYNRTKGSILAPALFHSSMNSFGNFLPGTTASTILLVCLAIFAIVYDKMWKKLPPDHPAVYQEPKLDG